MAWKPIGCLLIALLPGPLLARDLFNADISVDGAAARQFGFSNPTGAIDQFREEQLRAQFNYQDNSAVVGVIDFRGLPLHLGFAKDSPVLSFQVPSLGVNVSFRGTGNSLPSRRENAVERFEDFLQSEGGAVLRRIQKELMRVSPTDPLAGNPSSIESRMVGADFNRGFTHKVSQVYGCGSTAFRAVDGDPWLLASAEMTPEIFDDWENRFNQQRAANQMGIGLAGLRLRSGGFDSTTLTLPLAYTINFDHDPRAKLQLELPLSATAIGKARSYSGAFNLAYTHPISNAWSLTGGVGTSVAGSKDLGAAGGFASGSLTSSYSLRLGGWALNLGNGLGYYRSLKLSIGEYTSDPGVSNIVLTNGLLLSGPSSLLANGLVMEYFVTDSRFFGDSLYTERTDELGVSVGRVKFKSDGAVDHLLKGSVSVLVGEHNTRGVRLGLNYRF